MQRTLSESDSGLGSTPPSSFDATDPAPGTSETSSAENVPLDLARNSSETTACSQSINGCPRTAYVGEGAINRSPSEDEDNIRSEQLNSFEMLINNANEDQRSNTSNEFSVAGSHQSNVPSEEDGDGYSTTVRCSHG